AVTAAEASDAGQKSIEHMTRMVLAVSSQEAELMPKVAQAASLDGNSTRMVVNRLEAGSIDSYSPAKADRLYALLIKNGTWECPTLVELRGSSFFDDPLVDDPNDPRLKYVSSSMRRNWRQGGVSSKRTAEDFVAAKRIYNKKLEMVRAMERAGVGILAGSDMGNPYVFPGFGLHDELELLVKAGLTPMQSLQTATLNPARYLGKERELGTIEDGKLADLVLLDANPLTDIRNTRKIDAVVVAGKWVDKAQLQAMLAQVEAANRDR
ncbi:MAG: amidohydrolase family protein, partial [Steroidobacteraceae bacterium]